MDPEVEKAVLLQGLTLVVSKAVKEAPTTKEALKEIKNILDWLAERTSTTPPPTT